MRTHDYFEHDADIGIIGCGNTLEECFAAAAEAMFAIECTPEQIRSLQKITVEFSESDSELALVIWLNKLLGEAQKKRIALSHFQLRQEGGKWIGTASGEPWHRGLIRGVEVKGATLTMLQVKNSQGQWEARCVVDV